MLGQADTRASRLPRAGVRGGPRAWAGCCAGHRGCAGPCGTQGPPPRPGAALGSSQSWPGAWLGCPGDSCTCVWRPVPLTGVAQGAQWVPCGMSYLLGCCWARGGARPHLGRPHLGSQAPWRAEPHLMGWDRTGALGPSVVSACGGRGDKLVDIGVTQQSGDGCLSSVRLSCPLPHAGPRALKASGPGLARVCVCVYVHVCARTRLGEPHTCACAGPRLHVCPRVPVRAHGGLTQGRTSASRKPLLTAPTRSFPALVCLSVGLGLCFWRSAVTR